MVPKVGGCTGVLFLAATLAGCVGESDDSRPFGELSAEAWKPGYAWEWTAQGSGEFQSGATSASSSGSTSVRHEVLAVTTATDGGALYAVRRGPAETGLLDSEHVVLVEPATLEPVAVTFDDLDCIDTIRWDRMGAYPDPLAFPLEFPLKKDAQWSFERNGVEWSAEVEGAAPLDVPAGRFEAVRISLSAHESPEGPEGPDGARLGLTSDVSVFIWYSAEVRHAIAVDWRAKVRAVSEEGTLEAEQAIRFELRSYTLEAGPGVELGPVTLDRESSYRPFFLEKPTVHIVSDAAFPINSANGTGNVTFGLELGEEEWNLEGTPQRGEIGPFALEGDLANHTLHWTIATDRWGNDVWAEATGGSISFAPPIYGEFWVSVEAVAPPASEPKEAPSKCATSQEPRPELLFPELARARFEVRYARSFEVEFATLDEPARVLLDTIQAPTIHGDLTAQIEVQHESELAPDLVSLILTDPAGGESDVWTFSARLVAPGPWTLEWDARSFVPGPVPAPLLGHTARIDVDIRAGF